MVSEMVDATPNMTEGVVGPDIAAHPSQQSLRFLVISAGIGASVLFLLVGLCAELQMFGDGSIFSYSVAAQEAWSFHWHNISGRLFSYVFTFVPAETYVAFTGDAKGGVFLYGLLHFSAPLLGLLVTLATDRSSGRLIFTYACLSTACLCPLVFGVPTEMWMAHAVFWPALAICLSAPATLRGVAVRFAAFLALIFTHEGAVVLSIAILFAVFLRGWRERLFVVAIAAWSAAILCWLIIKLTIRPDEYIAGVLDAAALRFIDVGNLAGPIFLLLLTTLAAYGLMAVAFRRLMPAKAYICAGVVCVVALAVYWLWFDNALLAEARYKLRTVLLVVTPALGLLAAVQAMHEAPGNNFRTLAKLAETLETILNPGLISGALLLTMLIHAVETSKFVSTWSAYKSAVRKLAVGKVSDPALGDPHFVSALRIDAGLNRLAWNSTTPYLSVLLAPGLRAARLVVDPDTGYFWLSCETATKSQHASTAVPAESLRLVTHYACLHRAAYDK
jgi:hypothetical protein